MLFLFFSFFFFLLYPSSLLVCYCYVPEEDILLSKPLCVSCIFIRHRLLVSTFSQFLTQWYQRYQSVFCFCASLKKTLKYSVHIYQLCFCLVLFPPCFFLFFFKVSGSLPFSLTAAGVLQLTTQLDRETQHSYTFTVVAKDRGGRNVSLVSLTLTGFAVGDGGSGVVVVAVIVLVQLVQ